MPTHTHARQTANPAKASTVEEITAQFANSSAAVITEYRGLTVKQISTLRRALGRDTTYAVLKNTLAKRAAENAGVAIDESLLTGPTAIAFVGGDPVEAAKGLKQFAKDNPLLVIKGGVLDGKALSADEVKKIADLESREVLLAKVAGAIKALPARAAALFQAPLINAALLVKALEEKGGAAPQSAAPAAEAAPAEAVVEDEAPAAETATTEDAAATEAADTTEAADAADEAPAEPAE
jgi:large subunit ribosomal protein L10